MNIPKARNGNINMSVKIELRSVAQEVEIENLDLLSVPKGLKLNSGSL